MNHLPCRQCGEPNDRYVGTAQKLCSACVRLGKRLDELRTMGFTQSAIQAVLLLKRRGYTAAEIKTAWEHIELGD